MKSAVESAYHLDKGKQWFDSDKGRVKNILQASWSNIFVFLSAVSQDMTNDLDDIAVENLHALKSEPLFGMKPKGKA